MGLVCCTEIMTGLDSAEACDHRLVDLSDNIVQMLLLMRASECTGQVANDRLFQCGIPKRGDSRG